jgi:hypothetical protein
MTSAEFQALQPKKGKVKPDKPEPTKVQHNAATEATEASRPASMDEQRQAFVCDLIERLYPMGDVAHISNNVLLFTRGKTTYHVTIEIK